MKKECFWIGSWAEINCCLVYFLIFLMQIKCMRCNLLAFLPLLASNNHSLSILVSLKRFFWNYVYRSLEFDVFRRHKTHVVVLSLQRNELSYSNGLNIEHVYGTYGCQTIFNIDLFGVKMFLAIHITILKLCIMKL